MGTRLLFVWLLCGALLLPARACLNDRDSLLASSLARFPGIQDVIAGRFERNPPLFYEMRVARVERELAAHPDSLPLYDDLAVALDRLHRDDEAIDWMARKRVVLERVAPKENLTKPEAREHWYSYHANVGTFLAHRWLAQRGAPDDLRRGRDHIARAIQIKPEAHFGREPVQLMALDWMLGPRDQSFGDYLQDEFPRWFSQRQSDVRRRTDPSSPEVARWLALSPEKAAVEGLAGLVVLGAAWESVDVFDAMERFVHRQREARDLVRFRVDELTRAGRKSLSSEEPLSRPISDHENEWLRGRYQFLRDDADAWQKERTDYLVARLSAGRHPDTDPTFWNDWRPRPAPDLHPFWGIALLSLLMSNLIPLVVLGGPLLLVVIAVARAVRGPR